MVVWGYNPGGMTEPIATYAERLLQVRRVFRLYPDQVVVDAHWLWKGDFRSTIELSSLKRAYKERYVRNRLYKTAVWVAVLGAILAAFPLYPKIPWPLPVITYVGGVIALAGLAVAALAYRKILFVRFDSHDGKPGLDIARAGPGQAKFGEFVERVRKQIGKR